jgi:hypothetical protein
MMSENVASYTLAHDEKATPIMVYTMSGMVWGQIVTKEMVRVSTFLRTIAPDYVSLYDAHLLPLRAGGPEQALAIPEVHIRTTQVIAMHLLPPASEPHDYDPSETNRKMEPATVIVGPFRFDGLLRTSAMTDLAKHVEITREPFVSVYDIEASLPGMAKLGVIKAAQVLIRRDASLFAPRL